MPMSSSLPNPKRSALANHTRKTAAASRDKTRKKINNAPLALKTTPSVKSVPPPSRTAKTQALATHIRSVKEDRPASKVNQVPRFSPRAVANTDIRRLESNMNPYYQTLKSPSHVVGVRIPDDGAVDTCTFSVVLRESITISSAGAGAIVFGATENNVMGLIPTSDAVDKNGGAWSVPSSTPYVCGFKSGSLSSDTTGLFAASGPNPIEQLTLPNWDSALAAIPSLMERVRLVSAGMSAISTAASTALSGTYVLASTTRGVLRQFVPSVNSTLISQLPGAIQVPLNEGKGVSATYNPTDSFSFNFCDLDGSALTTNCPDYNLDLQDPGGFILGVVGATAGTTILVTLILNYEAIPLTQSLSFFNVSSAPQDPIALAEAVNMRESDIDARPGLGGLDGLSPTSGSGGSSSSAHPLLHRFPSLLASPGGGHSLISSPTRVSRRGNQPAGEFEQESTFEKILGMLLPVVKTVAPALLSLI